MLMKNENWPKPVALTSYFPVELPGIEPASLPGLLPSELAARYAPFRFVPVNYLRFRFRALTAPNLMTRQVSRPFSGWTGPR
jgi:hypothetical protein